MNKYFFLTTMLVIIIFQMLLSCDFDGNNDDNPSDNAFLSDLIVTSASFATTVPAFEKATYNYWSCIYFGTKIKITPTSEDSEAKILVNGQSVESGTPSQDIILSTSYSNIIVSTTGKDGKTTKTYILRSKICNSMCSDTEVNGDETDLNCGGSCLPCGFNKYCLSNSDCISNLCSSNRCQ